jgi:hypothetical protein
MEPLYFVMAIMGCGDAGMGCEQVRVEPARYRSVLECQAAMPDALRRNSDLSFPELTGTCQRKGLRMAKNETRPRG